MNFRLCIVVGLMSLLGCDPDSKSAGQADGQSMEVSMGSCDAIVPAEDFDTSCTENSDCVAVFEGPATEACQCAEAAINVSDAEAHLSELGPSSCTENECVAECGAVRGSQGACVDNQCVIGQAFACGDALSCNALNEICVFYGSDVSGDPGGYGCAPLPEACVDSLDCGCFVGQTGPLNYSFCVEEGECAHNGAGFELLCPGG